MIRWRTIVALAVFAAFSSLAMGQTLNRWDGGGNNNYWGTGANWQSNVPPVEGSNDVHIAGNIRTSSEVKSSAGSTAAPWDIFNLRSLAFTNSTSAFTLSGGRLVFNQGAIADAIHNNIAATQTVQNAITVSKGLSAGTRLFKVSQGTLKLEGPLFLDTVTEGWSTLELNAAAGTSGILNGQITGGGTVNTANTVIKKTGEGTWYLGGNNNYHGRVEIAAGALHLTNRNGLGSFNNENSEHTEFTGTGRLELSGNISVGYEVYRINGRSTDDPHILNVSGNNAVMGKLAIRGSNKFNFSSDSGYLTMGYHFGVNNIAMVFQLSGNGDGEFSNSLWGSMGSVIKSGNGTWSIYANDGVVRNYTGTTTIRGGVLKFGKILGEGNVILEGGVLGLAHSDFTRALGTGAGQVRWNGAAGGFAAYETNRIVNLGGATGAVSWASTANFVPNGKALVLGATNATHTVDFQNPINLNAGTRTVDVPNGPALVEAKLSSTLSGAGTSSKLVKTGAGTLELSGLTTFQGTTTVSNGALLVTGIMTNGQTVTFVNNTGLSGSGAIYAPVTMGTSCTLLPGVNTYGQLRVQGNFTTGTNTYAAFRLRNGLSGNTVTPEEDEADALANENRVDVSGAVTFKGRIQLLFDWEERYPYTDHWTLFRGASSFNLDISNATNGTFQVADIMTDEPTWVTVDRGLMTYDGYLFDLVEEPNSGGGTNLVAYIVGLPLDYNPNESYENWRDMWFEADNPLRNFTDDARGDGVYNGLAYTEGIGDVLRAYITEPMLYLTNVWVEAFGTNVMAAVYRERQGLSDATLTLEISTNRLDWSPGNLLAAQQLAAEAYRADEGWTINRYRKCPQTLPSGPYYYRLRATLNGTTNVFSQVLSSTEQWDTYSGWANYHLPADQTGFGQDPDDDGIPNGLAYAIGFFSPMNEVPDEDKPVLDMQWVNDTELGWVLAARFIKRDGMTDVELEAEASSSLDWAPGTLLGLKTLLVEPLTTAKGVEVSRHIVCPTNGLGGPVFYRLRASPVTP